MSVVVRPATSEDVRALMELRRQWGDEDHGSVDEPGFEKRFAEWFERTANIRNS